ncbi:hypothetical protein [Pseudomonas sp. EMN2]|uniref:hypothetical protein n=1 Tax=Pseudomonas sp. EMN2 TaxID=2615212 RepID=UPI001C49B1BB|nr:hypothetical protein [Pseudomonas sp. EMN2]
MTIDKIQIKALAEHVTTDRRFCADEYHRELATGAQALLEEVERLGEAVRIEKARGELLNDARTQAEELQWAAERKLADREALLDLLKVKLAYTPQKHLVEMIDQAQASSPPAAGQAYRLLTAVDVIDRADEYLDDNATTWLPAGPDLFVGRFYSPGAMVPIRRRVVQ